jgi:hypothetical protein
MMADQPRSKFLTRDFRLRRNCTDSRRCPVVGEHQILELISLGAPLPGILNKLCMMIDVRIGDVVSMVSLPDVDENRVCTITRSALQVGLDVFCSSAILSFDKLFLGSLEIFGCDPRQPTPLELVLIDRVTYLASLALQSQKVEEHIQPPSIKPRGKLLGPIEKPRFIN